MRTLVIDDEFIALSKMIALLEPLGQCDAATNGQQAMDLFRKSISDGCPYQLITIDINMPDTNGIRLLGQLQREEQTHNWPHARKLIVTAASTTSNVLAALTGDCDGFLAKPVRRNVLWDKLASLGLLPSRAAR